MTERLEIRLRTRSWHGDTEQKFALPMGWTADVCPPRDGPALQPDAIQDALTDTVGMSRIAQDAKGSKSAVLLVDDLQRPTPAEPLCLAVMDELNLAGIADPDISIIIAGGAHRPVTREDMAIKLGQALDRVGQALAHDAFSPDVEYRGVTSQQTPVLVNRVAAQADYVVGISSVYAHSIAGFGGGAKIVLPGISHISSIIWNHRQIKSAGRGSSPEDNPARRDMEEIARMFGLRATVAAVVNSRREICGLFVGKPKLAHDQAVAFARQTHYTDIDPSIQYDLVIANTYPMDSEPAQISKAMWPARILGLPTLLIADFYHPVLYHGMADGSYTPFAQNPFLELAPQTEKELQDATFFLYTPSYGCDFFPQRKPWYCSNDWEELMAKLEKRFPKAHALVLPVAPLQVIGEE